VDFRLGSDGHPYLLEINTLPGLNPRMSDLCIMARAEGIHYTDLINEILNLALSRYADQGGARRVIAHLFRRSDVGTEMVPAWDGL
jgi:hypothetical protein